MQQPGIEHVFTRFDAITVRRAGPTCPGVTWPAPRPSKAAAWLDTILARDWPQAAAVKIGFSLAQLSRPTGDRARDLDDGARDRIVQWLRRAGAGRAAVLVDQIVALEAREEYIALGATLPPGLHLVRED